MQKGESHQQVQLRNRARIKKLALLRASKGNEPPAVLVAPAVSAPPGQGRELLGDRLRSAAGLRALARAGGLESGEDRLIQPNIPTQAERDFPPCIQTK